MNTTGDAKANAGSRVGRAMATSGSNQGSSKKRKIAKKAYLTIEIFDENGSDKPFLKKCIILELPCHTSIYEFMQQTVDEYAPTYKYVHADVISLTTGRGTSLETAFANEPVDALSEALEEGEKWHLIAILSMSNGSLFSSLEDKIVKELFSYVGGAKDFLACEKTCSRFKSILLDDDVWKTCDGAEGERGSYRERALTESVVDSISKEQKSNRKNNILSVLSPGLIGYMVNQWFVQRHAKKIILDIRGDSLGYALDAVEEYILMLLKHANLISINSAKKANEYPEVTTDDLQLAERLQTKEWTSSIWRCGLWESWGDTNQGFFCKGDSCNEANLKAIDDEFTDIMRFKLARLLANKAGIVKITNDAMKRAVNLVFVVLGSILMRPAKVQDIYHRCTRFEFDSEESIDLWNDIPSALYSIEHERYEIIVVPSQIEESVIHFGLNKVYGSRWALSEGQTLEEAVIAAKQRYKVKPEPHSSDEETEEKSMSDTSESEEESDFSVYDDKDCPDARGSSVEEDSSEDETESKGINDENSKVDDSSNDKEGNSNEEEEDQTKV